MKTLKDIMEEAQREDYGIDDVDLMLCEVAKEWIKTLEKKDWHSTPKGGLYFGIDVSEEEAFKGAIMWIKFFFNLEEK